MDGSTEHAFPTPETTDSAEVRTELETGATLWLSDPREALRCLRRAAEGAADAGDDGRSVYLARAAADLRSQASVQNSIVPGAELTGEPPQVIAQPPASETTLPDAAAATVAAPEVDPITPAMIPSVGSGATIPGIPAAMRGLGNGGFAAAPAGKSDASAPRFAGMGHDPAQTVPATPAASAAMALQEAAAQAIAAAPHFQVSPPGVPTSAPSPESSMQTTWPTGVPMMNTALNNANPMNTVNAGPSSSTRASDALITPVAMHSPVSVAPTSIGRGFGGAPGLSQPASAAAPYSLSAAMAASNPTPVEVPAIRRAEAEAAARGDAAPQSVSSRANASADEPAPNSVGRFVEHRALRVSVSPRPNASGHFEIHPLAGGEAPEAGWRVALLVGLDETDRLFPGRS